MLRKLLAGATTVVAAAGLSIAGLAAPASASGTNPLAAAQGFTVLTQGDATMSGGSETEGSWAVGGDLTVASHYNLLANHDGSALPSLGGTSVQLLTGGKVGFDNVSSETLDLNAGALRVGDTNGYTVTQGNRYSTAADTSTFARTFSNESIADITSGLYASTFGSAFTTLDASASAIHGLDASTANVLTLIGPSNQNGVSANDMGLQLQSGVVNVLHVTAAQLSSIGGTIDFLGGVMPSASTPLYIDVTDAGAVDVRIPDVMGHTASAPYVLYNFASATSVDVHGTDLIDGAILAPSAAVSMIDATYEGQIVAKSFTASAAREIHNEMFGGTLTTTPSTPKDASAAPTVTPPTCDSAATLVLPTPTHASWGTPTITTGPGDYTVVATADSGHLFADGSSTQTFTGHLDGALSTGCDAQITPTAPTASTTVTCDVDGSYTLPSQTGVIWEVTADDAGVAPGTRTVTAAGTYPADAQLGDVTVTVDAVPASGTQFTAGATTEWVFSFTAPQDCLPTLADFTIEYSHTDAVCSTSGGTPMGSIWVGGDDAFPEVEYVLDGVPVTQQTTSVTAGQHVLTAQPRNPQDTVDNPGPYTITVAAPGTACTAELKTLALTGADPTAWGVAGLGLLTLGGALVAIRLLRRRRDGRHLA